jgi:hypothetical protein
MAERKASKGFTDDERAAISERAHEVKSASRRGSRGTKADGESDVLAKIAEMPDHDRAIAERIHAIITAAAPSLSPRTWYGMPAYARDGRSSVSSRAVTSSRRGTRRSASATGRTSTRAPCGRTPTR